MNNFEKYINQRSLTYFITIFVILYLATSLISFIGQLPILIIISIIGTYYYMLKYDNNDKEKKINVDIDFDES